MDELSPLHTTLPSAVRRYWWLVLLCVALPLLLTSLYVARQPTTYSATASLLVEDPRVGQRAGEEGGLFNPNPERYVADQVLVMEFADVFERAERILDAYGVGADLSTTEVYAAPDSNLMSVTVQAATRQGARAGANALAVAYQVERLVQQATTVPGRASLLGEATARLRSSLAAVRDELGSLAPLANDTSEVRDLLSREPALTVGPDGAGDSSATGLNTGVLGFMPARSPGEPDTTDASRLFAVSLLVGAVLGVGLAYYLSARRPVVDSPDTAELVLDAPLLADISVSSGEEDLAMPGTTGEVASEQYRFMANALEVGVVAAGARRVVNVSTDDETTRRLVTMGTALAASQSGSAVLVVDGDLSGSQDSLLLPPGTRRRGMAELVERGMSLEQTVQNDAGPGGRLSVLARGRLAVDANRFYREPAVKAAITASGDRFDMVLIDSPSLVHVGYAFDLVRLAEAAVVTVPQGTPVSDLQRVATRLRLAGVSTAGFVYCRPTTRGPGRLIQQRLTRGRRDRDQDGRP